MKKYLAEVIGTFVLVLFGCGSAVFANSSTSAIGWLGISFAFGLSIVAMAYTVGSVSGCHLNPAVSFAMLINKRLGVTDFCGYVASQIIGAIAGAGVIGLFHGFMGTANGLYGANVSNFSNGTIAGALVAEIILTFIFVLMIVMVTSAKRGAGPLAGLMIGLTLVLIHILGIPLTGTSVNPARSIGPALFTGGKALEQLWIFIVAPLIGGGLAAVVGRFLGSEEK